MREKWFTRLRRAISPRACIDIVGGYLDGPGHEFYFIFETNDQSKLVSALVPLMQIGDVKTVPVVKFSDVVALTRKLGIQE